MSTKNDNSSKGDMQAEAFRFEWVGKPNSSGKAKTPQIARLCRLSAHTSQGQFGQAFRAETTDNIASEPIKSEASSAKLTTYFLKSPASGDSGTDLDRAWSQCEAEFSKKAKLERIRKLSTRDASPMATAGSQSIFTVSAPIAFGRIFGPGIHDAGKPAIVYPWVDGNDLLNGELVKFRDISTFLEFARGFTELLQRLHNAGLVHSFIVPRHVIADSKRKTHTLVGFGYSNYCTSEEVGTRPTAPTPDGIVQGFPASKVIAEWDIPYLAPEIRVEARIGALWYPADIYSVGAILLRGIIGKEVDAKFPRDRNLLKERVYELIKGNNSKLFEENENIVKIIDRCLRYKPEDRYSCAEDLLEALELVSEKNTKQESSENSNRKRAGIQGDVQGILYTLAHISKDELRQQLSGEETDASESKQSQFPTLFQTILAKKGKEAQQAAQHVGRGHFEVFGDRDYLVNWLCHMLGKASKGSRYRTTTLPGYWSDSNLGSNGRFLTMNKHAVRTREMKVQRIFLVADEFSRLPEEEQDILMAHQRAADELGKPKKGSFEVRVLNLGEKSTNSTYTAKKQIAPDEVLPVLNDFETKQHIVAMLYSGNANSRQSTPKDTVFLNFISQGRECFSGGQRFIQRHIKKVRFWDPSGDKEDVKNAQAAFDHDWEIAIPLATYLGSTTPKPKLADLLFNTLI